MKLPTGYRIWMFIARSPLRRRIREFVQIANKYQLTVAAISWRISSGTFGLPTQEPDFHRQNEDDRVRLNHWTSPRKQLDVEKAAAPAPMSGLNSAVLTGFGPLASAVVKNLQNSIVMRVKTGAETMSPSIVQGALSASARCAPG